MSTTFWIIIGGVCALIWIFFFAIFKSSRLREEAWKRAIARAVLDQEMKEGKCL